MSSPIQDAKNLDPILKHAPQYVRDQMPKMPPATPIEWPIKSQREENSSAFSGDREVLEVQRRLALDPSWIPEPPRSFANERDIWWITLRATGAIGVAAFVAWVVVLMPGAGLLHDQRAQTSFVGDSISTKIAGAMPLLTTTSPQPERAEGPHSTEPTPPMLMEVPMIKQAPAEIAREQPHSAQPRPERPEGSASVAEKSASERDRLDSTGPAPPMSVEVPLINQTAAEIAREQPHSAQPIAPDLITRQLNRDEVTSLLRRGEDFLKAGDLVSARLVFRRATEAGDARAALALAGTFDPGVLEKLGFAGFWADVAMARMWYQRAAQFGSAEAPQRLQQLATKINPVP